MKQLTDSMIANALQNTVWMKEDNTLLIIILICVVLFAGSVFVFTRNTRQKIGAGGTLVLFLVMGIALISQNSSMKKAINNSEWEVHTDIVEQVMESTDEDGDKDYFMVLKTYGRVSLDNYADAIQYYSGQLVYIVVVPKGNSYEDTGITYPKDVYIYVGDQ